MTVYNLFHIYSISTLYFLSRCWSADVEVQWLGCKYHISSDQRIGPWDQVVDRDKGKGEDQQWPAVGNQIIHKFSVGLSYDVWSDGTDGTMFIDHVYPSPMDNLW